MTMMTNEATTKINLLSSIRRAYSLHCCEEIKPILINITLINTGAEANRYHEEASRRVRRRAENKFQNGSEGKVAFVWK